MEQKYSHAAHDLPEVEPAGRLRQRPVLHLSRSVSAHIVAESDPGRGWLLRGESGREPAAAAARRAQRRAVG